MTGVFLDIDHLFDYVIHTGWNINVKRFFQYSYQLQYKRLYLPLHGYEYLMVIILCLLLFSFHPLVVAVGVGYSLHLVLDHIFNQAKPLAYFLSYRVKHRFSVESFFEEEKLSCISKD